MNMESRGSFSLLGGSVTLTGSHEGHTRVTAWVTEIWCMSLISLLNTIDELA